jgi:ABC-2 type transport system ATP-binding protein
MLRIEGLRLSHGNHEILRDVNLDLRQGEIYGLLGPNGAGKSTTIAAAIGLLKPDGGSISLFGQPVAGDMDGIRRQLGVLPERLGYYDWMTAEGYLAFFASLYGKDMSAAQIASRLEQVDLSPRSRQVIGTFSQGMRQRLGLARALIPDPRLLFLDEPTNGLDPRGRREIHDILVGLAKKGTGILLCTHVLDDVERLCGRVGILLEGRTVAEGKVADLLQRSQNASRFRIRLAGDPPGGDNGSARMSVIGREGDWWLVDVAAAAKPDAVWRELLFREWPIVEIQRATGGLEDLYLALTERKAA